MQEQALKKFRVVSVVTGIHKMIGVTMSKRNTGKSQSSQYFLNPQTLLQHSLSFEACIKTRNWLGTDVGRLIPKLDVWRLGSGLRVGASALFVYECPIFNLDKIWG